jgi:hypothetical protein
VASTSWDPKGEAEQALRTIVSDPQYGAAALSSSQTMTNLLKDLLPDAPREASVLIAAADAGVAGSLQTYMSQGMDVGTASRLVAGSFENRTALTPEACHWVVGAMVTALRLDEPTVVPASAQETRLPGDVRPTLMDAAAAPGAMPGRPSGLSLAGALVAVGGAIFVTWACALPDLVLPAIGSGRHSYSIFNSGAPGGGWFAVEPVGVAVVGILAAAGLLAATNAPRLRLLATGALLAMGVQTLLLFAGYQFSVRTPDHSSAGGVVGILGALLLLAAGALGAAGVFNPPANPVSGSWGPGPGT